MEDVILLRSYLESRLPDALDLLHRLVTTNSYTGNADGVNRVGDLTAEAFQELGFTAERVPSAQLSHRSRFSRTNSSSES